MRRLLLTLVVLLPSFVLAQTPGTCVLGTARGDLATPDLFARVFNTGALFFGNQTPSGDGYLVPRASGNSPIFAAALWIGGVVGGEGRTAAGAYSNNQLWPGPLDAGAALPNPADCSAYDRIWVVAPADVAAYEAGGTPTADLAQWPVGLGAPAVDAQGLPVPVGSRFQRIDLPGGERPVLGGGPTAFWVMNDVGGARWDQGNPLGVEVQVTAFAPASGPTALRQSSFYRFTVVNRNALPIEDLQLGFFVDPDLGYSGDDYVGVDTTRGMALTYNVDNSDAVYGIPPALGLDLLSGLWSSSYSTEFATDIPSLPGQFLYRMRGLWNDGSPIREYGDGYEETQGAVTRFTFSGDPVAGAFWSERQVSPGGPPAPIHERRFVLAAPPVSLAPGASRSVDVGVLFAQGASHLNSVSALRAVSDRAQAAYVAGTLFSGQFPQGTAAAPALAAPADGASFYESDVTFSWEAVPGADGYVLEVSATTDFAEIDLAVAEQTQVTFPAARFPSNRTGPVYWRVRATEGGLDGPPSAARAVRAYHYVGEPLTLASGAYAIVETTAPGGGPACSGPADPDEGCVEVGGDLVFNSLNSTADYAAGNLDPTASAAFAPTDFEIRFTAAGSIAYSTGAETRLFRVPFEVWDVGVVAPGAVNDPSDDRQLVAFLTSVPVAGLCRFSYVNPTRLGIGLRTPYMRAFYPTGNDYAAYAAIAEPLVAGDPAGCPSGSAAQQAIEQRVARFGGSPVRSFFLEQASARTTAELAGSTVRFYTLDRVVASEGSPVEAGALALGAAYPNPARGRVTVPLTLAGPARLRVVDVLGRTVLEQRLDGGTREARLDVRRLAPGVYAVVLDAAEARAVRMLTVVR